VHTGQGRAAITRRGHAFPNRWIQGRLSLTPPLTTVQSRRSEKVIETSTGSPPTSAPFVSVGHEAQECRFDRNPAVRWPRAGDDAETQLTVLLFDQTSTLLSLPRGVAISTSSSELLGSLLEPAVLALPGPQRQQA
jgi:hypothetical protein